MRKGFCLLFISGLALTAIPNTSEAFGWRPRLFHSHPVCPPVTPACCPTTTMPSPAAMQAMPGITLAPSAQEMPATKNVVIKGKSYQIIPHPDRGDAEDDERDSTTQTLPPGAAGSNIPASDRFNGTARRVTKTSIANAPVEEFPTVAALLASLPANNEMRGTIPSTPNSNRVTQEKRNVKVTGFIYAFKKESDNDYHVIIGDAPGALNLNFLNTEVSGIPIAGTDETREILSQVRNQFKSTFELNASGPSSYFRPNPPVPVAFTGSLFWDVDHENPPLVGPQDFKPKTPWEIHPITAIEFLNP